MALKLVGLPRFKAIPKGRWLHPAQGELRCPTTPPISPFAVDLSSMADRLVRNPMSVERLCSQHPWLAILSVCWRAITIEDPIINFYIALTDPSYRGQILVFTQPLM